MIRASRSTTRAVARASRNLARATALAIALPAAAAPPEPAPASDTIVVTGNRATPAQLRERATRYVTLISPGVTEREVARWTDPLCPRVLNLEARYAAIVEARLRAVAASVGAPLARAPCAANLVVTFAHDAAAVVETIARRSPRSLAEVPPPARAVLRTGDAPVRWWYATATRGRDGRPATAGSPLWAGGVEGGGSVLPEKPAIASYGDTLTGSQSTRVITAATVIVDIDGARGHDLAAVADYAAFVALAEIDAAASPPPGSVLALFGDDARPRLGDGDRSFLRALYAMPLDRNARRQRGRLLDALTAAPAG